MHGSLQSRVGVRSPDAHWSAGRYILFNLSIRPGEPFHEAGNAHSVRGRGRLNIRRLATKNVMP